MPFTSDPSTHRQCFDVTIFDDNILEDTETFNLTLSLVSGSSVPVTILPDVSEVEIVDEDCKSEKLCCKLTVNILPLYQSSWLDLRGISLLSVKMMAL